MLADGAGGVEDVKLPSNVNAVPELMGHAVLKLHVWGLDQVAVGAGSAA